MFYFAKAVSFGRIGAVNIIKEEKMLFNKITQKTVKLGMGC